MRSSPIALRDQAPPRRSGRSEEALNHWFNLNQFLFPLYGSFFQTAQHFRDAPGLGDAAARRERRLGVKDFADRAEARFSEMRLEAVEEMPRHHAIIGVDLEPRIDERADQPSPYRALVIGGIAGTHIAEIARLVLGF